MKMKLMTALATSGFALGTLAITACESTGGGSHNMGTNRTYQPMPDENMPARKGGTRSNSTEGSHNMGTNRTYQPMPNSAMPYRN